jgi:hypothetical protein
MKVLMGGEGMFEVIGGTFPDNSEHFVSLVKYFYNFVITTYLQDAYVLTAYD